MRYCLMITALWMGAVSFSPSTAAAAALDDVVITDVDISPRTVRPGGRVRITFRVRNRSTRTALTQGPRPGAVYRQGVGWQARGFAPVPGRFRVGVALSGPTGRQTLYRWGLGGSLPPLGFRRITGYLRFRQPGHYTLYPSVILEGAGEQPHPSVGLIRVTGADRRHRRVAYRIMVDGQPAGADVDPRLIGATIMVPLRFIAEELGAAVDWQHYQKRVVISRGGKTVTTRVGSHQLRHNGDSVTIYQPARIIRGRIFVPLRAVGHALGVGVEWDGRTRTVLVRTGAPPGPTGPI